MMEMFSILIVRRSTQLCAFIKTYELHTKKWGFTTCKLCFHKKKMGGRKEGKEGKTHSPAHGEVIRDSAPLPHSTECWMPTSAGGRAELESEREKKCQVSESKEAPEAWAGSQS